jgi:hypothetical protein
MICTRCGTEVPDPPILRARAAGFDSAIHCRIYAAHDGLVVKCINHMGRHYCESCPMSRNMLAGKPNKTK